MKRTNQTHKKGKSARSDHGRVGGASHMPSGALVQDRGGEVDRAGQGGREHSQHPHFISK